MILRLDSAGERRAFLLARRAVEGVASLHLDLSSGGDGTTASVSVGGCLRTGISSAIIRVTGRMIDFNTINAKRTAIHATERGWL